MPLPLAGLAFAVWVGVGFHVKSSLTRESENNVHDMRIASRSPFGSDLCTAILENPFGSEGSRKGRATTVKEGGGEARERSRRQPW